MKVLHIIVAIGLIGSIKAQNVSKDISSLLINFQNLQNVQANLTMHMYSSFNGETPMMTQHYAINKRGNDFLYNINGSMFLFNKNCALMINDKEKYIYYNKHEGKPELPEELKSFNLDSSLQLCDSIAYQGTTEMGKKYSFFRYHHQISETVVYLDISNSHINRIIYYLNPEFAEVNNKIEVIYNEWNTEPVFAEGIFDEKNYVSKSKGQMKGKNDYYNYKVIANYNR